MRRSQIAEAAHDVRLMVKHSQVLEVLDEMVSSGPSVSKEKKLLEGFETLAARHQALNDRAKEVSRKMGTNRLASHGFWAEVLTGDPSGADLKTKKREVRALYDTVSMVEDLVSIEDTESSEEEEDGRITIILVDREERGRSIKDIQEVVEGMDTLYSTFDAIEKRQENAIPEKDLRLLAADTGSELALTFIGAAMLIDSMNALIQTVWDRVEYAHTRQASEELDTIFDSLGVIEEINRMEGNEISEQGAEQMRRATRKTVRNMVKSGAITSEIEQEGEERKQIASSTGDLLLDDPDNGEADSELETGGESQSD